MQINESAKQLDMWCDKGKQTECCEGMLGKIIGWVPSGHALAPGSPFSKRTL